MLLFMTLMLVSTSGSGSRLCNRGLNMSIDIDEMYAGLSNAETGGEKNPHIRTKVRTAKGGSSAFGPVQITGTLAKGANKNKYLKKSKDFYEKEMKPRYDKMLYHGNMKGKIKDFDERYDYGGGAEFDEKKHGENYKTFAKEIMEGVAKEAKGDDKEFIKKWRGASKEDDPKYYERVKSGRSKYKLEAEMTRQLER